VYPFLAHLRRDRRIQNNLYFKRRVTELRSDSYNTKKHVTFQMHLQNKLGMWQSIQPSHTFCTFSQTGHLPPLCLWLFFCSERECGENHHRAQLYTGDSLIQTVKQTLNLGGKGGKSLISVSPLLTQHCCSNMLTETKQKTGEGKKQNKQSHVKQTSGL